MAIHRFYEWFYLAVIKWRLTLASNDAQKREGSTMSHAGVVNQILMRHVTDAVIAKANEEIRNFEQVPLLLRGSPTCYGA